MQFSDPRRLAFLIGGILGIFLIIFFFVRYHPFRDKNADEGVISPAPIITQDVEAFIGDYWKTPISLQGAPPSSFTEREVSLSPDACGKCHPQQYKDWRESLHSRAMGSGPWGQIIDTTRNNPQEAALCVTCHAPLTEQFPLMASASAGAQGGYVENPDFNPRLQLRGITCAACHVRRHQRFGPPKAQDGSHAYPDGMPNHGGVQRTPHFERAEFCRGCHQFDPENSFLINGKPLQDTYREWQGSIWGRDGATCQECHMPERRHLWKGIHDREMVRNGVRIETRIKKASSGPGDPFELEVKVANAAVGHKFPTYTTPKVFVRAALLDAAGKVLPRSQQEKIIGWDARFEGGQWREFFDTRIPPGEMSLYGFHWTLPRQAHKARVWLEVHPDHFYHVHFYPAYLTGGNLSSEGRELIEKALEESGHTPYTLFTRDYSLDRP